MGKLNVVGLGYIGLPTALMFASSGIEVVGSDYNNEIIKKLVGKEVTFEENGLEELFNNAENNIKFTTKYAETDKYIISVPTPYIKETKKVDPSYIVEAVNGILNVCKKGSILIIESTISPGTIDNYVRPLIIKKGYEIGKDIYLVHAPERIIPGNMIYELENNSRVIGCDDRDIGEEVKKMYSLFCKGEIVITSIRIAELSKVVENTFRDINIAYANELVKICRKNGIDVYELIEIANKHPRVNILQPGPGVGGHCISVDPWFLVGDYPEIVNVILAAREVNDGMPNYVLERIFQIMIENGISEYSKIGLYGLTYKENVDDIRESPTLQLLEKMDELSIRGVKVYDPMVKKEVVNGQYFSFNDFIEEVELVVIMVKHNHILENMHLLKDKVVFDTKNIVDGYSNSTIYSGDICKL